MIEELLSRGITDAEFGNVLAPRELHYAALLFRANRTMNALLSDSRFQRYFTALTARLESLSNAGGIESSRVADEVISNLRNKSQIDLSDLACRYLSKRFSVHSSLSYLADRGKSKAHSECVKKAVISPEMERLRSRAQRSIDARSSESR